MQYLSWTAGLARRHCRPAGRAWRAWWLVLLVSGAAWLPARAQQPGPWVDPLPGLIVAMSEAESRDGRRSQAYMQALQGVLQVRLQRGEFAEAAELIDTLVSLLAEVLPADDPNLAQARTLLAQLQQQAVMCGPARSAASEDAPDPLGFRLVSQSANFDGNDSALSSDGRWLAATAGHALVVRDLETGLVVRQIRDTPSKVERLAFVPHSGYLVGAFNNGCVAVWDARNGRRTAVAGAPPGARLTDLAVSPDGTLLAAAYAGTLGGQAQQHLSVWDIKDGTLTRRYFLDDKFHFLQQPVDAKVRFSPNSRALFSYSFLNTRVWNMTDGSLLNAGPSSSWIEKSGGSDQQFLQELALSPDGHYLALRTDKAVWLLDARQQFSVVHRFELPDYASSSRDVMHFSADGNRLLAGPGALYEVTSGKRIALPEGVSPWWSDWVDGKRLLLLSSTSDYLLWDGEQPPQYRPRPGTWGVQVEVAFANGGSLLAAGGSYWDLDTLYMRDEKPAEVHFDAPLQGGPPRYLNWAPDDGSKKLYLDHSEHLYSAHDDGVVRLWSVPDGKVLAEQRAQPGKVSALAVSADERYLATASGGKALLDFSDNVVPPASVTVRDLHTGKDLWSSHEHAGSVSALRISPDGRYLVSMSQYRIEVHELASGRLLRTLENQPADGMFTQVAVNGRGQLAYFSAFGWPRLDARVAVMDMASGAELKSYRNDNDVGSLALSPNGELLAAAQVDGVVRLWSLRTDRSVALAQAFLSEPDEAKTLESLFNPPREWVAYTPDGYFAAGRGGTDLVAVVRGMEAYNLDQFGLRFNRPDILLERLGLGDAGVIEHFRLRHQARLRQAGLVEQAQTARLAIPVVDIVATEASSDTASLQLAFSADEVDLRSYNVHVNGVPLYPGRGRPLSGGRGKATVQVPLSAGDNLVEVSVLAANGMESPRKGLRFQGPVSASKPDLYFIGFGVSHYANPSLNLGYAHKDVQDLAAMFGASKQFGQVHVHAYTDAAVTPAAIAAAKDELMHTGRDDVVVVLVAGHGIHDHDAAGTYYYLTYGANPAHLADTAADFGLLESLLVDIPARNRLFLLDTCESGELEPAFVAGVFQDLADKQVRARTARGLTLDPPETQGVAPQPRPYLQQRSRYIYNDLSRRNGVVMFASSAGHELSYESERIQNGYFTEAVMKVLGESGRKDLEVLRRKVRDLVIKYSDGKQHPGVYWNNLHSRLYFDPIPASP